MLALHTLRLIHLPDPTGHNFLCGMSGNVVKRELVELNDIRICNVCRKLKEKKR
jgi:hypothetical protein